MSQASAFSAMIAFAYGHDVALPCLMPNSNLDLVFPCLVIIVTGALCIVSVAHSTYPCFGHPRLCSAVHSNSCVIRSKNFPHHR